MYKANNNNGVRWSRGVQSRERELNVHSEHEGGSHEGRPSRAAAPTRRCEGKKNDQRRTARRARLVCTVGSWQPLRAYQRRAAPTSARPVSIDSASCGSRFSSGAGG